MRLRPDITQTAYHQCSDEIVSWQDALRSVDPQQRRRAQYALAMAEKRIYHVASKREVFKRDFVSCVQQYVNSH